MYFEDNLIMIIVRWLCHHFFLTQSIVDTMTMMVIINLFLPNSFGMLVVRDLSIKQ